MAGRGPGASRMAGGGTRLFVQWHGGTRLSSHTTPTRMSTLCGILRTGIGRSGACRMGIWRLRPTVHTVLTLNVHVRP
eukprot:2696877-Prymnesium_polylepis.1